MSCPFCGSDNSFQAAFCCACGAELPRLGDGGQASAEALPVGTLLGGTYAVESVLGQGGFGITYCAHDQMLDRRVAIKEFFPAGCRREDAIVQPARGLSDSHFSEARAQFLAEARLLARCHHAGIVGVHTAFEANSTAYMVMELLHGSHLGQLLDARGGRLPEAEAVPLIERAGEALQFVHDQGLLHRDIKPENIIVCDDGRVMLIDFGTAREYAQGQAQGHTIVVTPGYAPLEQYAKQARRGAFTDVYGLAATLYHLLTGQAPPAASDRAVGVQLRPVREENSQISSGVARATEAGLEMEIAKRPQSVREFLELMDAPAIQAPARAAAFEIALMPHETAMANAQRDALLALSSPPANFFSTANQARQQMLNEALADPQPASPVPLLSLLAPQSIITPPAASGAPFGMSPNNGGGVLTKPYSDDSAKFVVLMFGSIMAFLGLVVLVVSMAPKPSSPSYSQPIVGYGSPNYSTSTYQPVPTPFSRTRITPEETARKEMESTPAILPASMETLPISAKVKEMRSKPPVEAVENAASILSQGLAEFSPDGRLVAYMDSDAVVRVWNLARHRVVSSLPQSKSHPPVDIRFSPDAKTVALTYEDQGEQRGDRVSVWNLATEKALGTLSVDPKKEWLIAGAVLPDGRVLIAKTDVETSQQRLFLWDPLTGKQSAAPGKRIADVYDVVFSADGQQMVTGDKMGHIRWIDTRTGAERTNDFPTLTYRDFQASPFYSANIPADTDLTDPLPVEALRLSRNSSYLASRNAMQIRVFDLSEAHEIGVLPIGRSPEFAVSPDGRWVVESSKWRSPERTMLWNVPKRQKVRLQGPTGHLKAWSFSPDGQQVTGLASSPEGASLVTWRTDAKPIAPFSGPQTSSVSLPTSSSRSVRAVSLSGRISAMQIGKSLEIRRFDGLTINSLDVGESPVEGMAFSPDGKVLAGWDFKGGTRLWNVQSGLEVAQLKELEPVQLGGTRFSIFRGQNLKSMMFSPDSSLFMRAENTGGKNLIEVWSLKLKPRQIAFLSLSHPLTALAFSPDNRALICGDEEGRLRLYDVATQKLVAQIQNSPAPICRLVSTRQGLAVVNVASKEKPVLLTLYDVLSSGAATKPSASRKRPVFLKKSQTAIDDIRGNEDSLVLSPDGQWMATASYFKPQLGSESEIHLWHLPTRILFQTLVINRPATGASFSSGPSLIESLEFSADGSQLTCMSREMTGSQPKVITWRRPPRQETSP